MGNIFDELDPIDIPDFAISCKNRRVIVVKNLGGGKREQTCIGQTIRDLPGKMHPNLNFKMLYPFLWEKYYGKKYLKPSEISIGLYCLFLGSAYKNGLYKVMQDSFGIFKTNRILDYAMFNTHEHLNSSYLITDFAKVQLLFSDKKPAKNTYTDFFKHELDKDLNHHFRLAWLNHCASVGHNKVWLCIDGSNNDCTVQGSKLAEHGNSKSHNAVKIYSYMWAVSAKDGRPITYILNNGSKVDSKAFEEIAKLLASSNMEIEGVIVDRGFATADCIKLIRELKFKYVVMLKSNSLAYKSMFEQYSSKIFWNFSYAINGDGIFGVSQKEKVFASSDEEAYVGLYFNGQIGSRKSLEFIKKVFSIKDEVAAQVANKTDIEHLSLSKDAKRYLNVFKDNDGKIHVEFNDNVCQSSICEKGYNAIACSENYTAKEISELYDLRDVSEKQFSIFKSQLGNDVTRVHSDESIEAKLSCGFIAAIIRTELAIACKELKFDTNKIIREADFCRALLMANDKYKAIHNHSERMGAVFKYFGIEEKYLDSFAEEINHRNTGSYSQERTLPPFTPAKGKTGRPKKEKSKDEENKPKRGVGRPKGSKNKKTIEKEKKLQEAIAKGEYVEPPKRGPGRPKGAKNKKTLEREAKLKAMQEHRGRGRPKGSKNKKTLEREAQQKAAAKSKTQRKTTTTKPQAPQGDPKVQSKKPQTIQNNGVQNTTTKGDPGPHQKTSDQVQLNKNIPPD